MSAHFPSHVADEFVHSVAVEVHGVVFVSGIAETVGDRHEVVPDYGEIASQTAPCRPRERIYAESVESEDAAKRGDDEFSVGFRHPRGKPFGRSPVNGFATANKTQRRRFAGVSVEDG